MVYKRFYSVFQDSANRILAGRSCVFCGLSVKTGSICSVCTRAIRQSGYHCYQCGAAISVKLEQQRCGDCLQNPKPYQRLISACHYNFPINNTVSRFKFNRQLHLGKALTELLTDKIQNTYKEDSLPELIIPIPLHHKRLAERGFNQSQLIAKQVSRELNLPIKTNLLTRIKNTPHQIGLKEAERRKNLKGAFAIKQALPKHIALVDDVVTTGSTITEASKQCLKQAAERVDIWCLAKT